MTQPDIDVFQLIHHLRAQHKIAPAEPRGDQFGREVGAEIRLVVMSGGEAVQVFSRHDQRGPEKRFAVLLMFDPQHAAHGKEMVGLEQANHFKPALQIGSRKNEGGGLARRQMSAVRLAGPAAEFSEATADVFVGRKKRIEHLRAQVRDQGQDQHNTFIEIHVAFAHHARIFGVVVAHIRRRICVDVGAVGVALEIQIETRVHHLAKPGDFLFQSERVLPCFSHV